MHDTFIKSKIFVAFQKILVEFAIFAFNNDVFWLLLRHVDTELAYKVLNANDRLVRFVCAKYGEFKVCLLTENW